MFVENWVISKRKKLAIGYENRAAAQSPWPLSLSFFVEEGFKVPFPFAATFLNC
jgi:hypothetical protein